MKIFSISIFLPSFSNAIHDVFLSSSLDNWDDTKIAAEFAKSVYSENHGGLKTVEDLNDEWYHQPLNRVSYSIKNHDFLPTDDHPLRDESSDGDRVALPMEGRTETTKENSNRYRRSTSTSSSLSTGFEKFSDNEPNSCVRNFFQQIYKDYIIEGYEQQAYIDDFYNCQSCYLSCLSSIGDLKESTSWSDFTNKMFGNNNCVATCQTNAGTNFQCREVPDLWVMYMANDGNGQTFAEKQAIANEIDSGSSENLNVWDIFELNLGVKRCMREALDAMPVPIVNEIYSSAGNSFSNIFDGGCMRWAFEQNFNLAEVSKDEMLCFDCYRNCISNYASNLRGISSISEFKTWLESDSSIQCSHHGYHVDEQKTRRTDCDTCRDLKSIVHDYLLRDRYTSIESSIAYANAWSDKVPKTRHVANCFQKEFEASGFKVTWASSFTDLPEQDNYMYNGQKGHNKCLTNLLKANSNIMNYKFNLRNLQNFDTCYSCHKNCLETSALPLYELNNGNGNVEDIQAWFEQGSDSNRKTTTEFCESSCDVNCADFETLVNILLKNDDGCLTDYAKTCFDMEVNFITKANIYSKDLEEGTDNFSCYFSKVPDVFTKPAENLLTNFDWNAIKDIDLSSNNQCFQAFMSQIEFEPRYGTYGEESCRDCYRECLANSEKDLSEYGVVLGGAEQKMA